MTVCIRCIVSGKVQGVFYRATTQQQAQLLNITGYAKNLADGSVEVLACGEQTAIQQLQAWLWQGPKASEVESVICNTTKIENLPIFTIA